jgi:zinc protease
MMNIKIIFLLIVTVAGCSSKVERIKTSSGASIYAFQDNNTPLIHLQIVIQSAGTLNEPAGKEGLSDITAELMKLGTRSFSKDAYQKVLDGIGSSLNVSSGPNGMAISGTFMKEKALQYLSVVKSVLTEPLFEQKELALEIEKHKNFITTALKNDLFLIDYYYNKTWFKDHPYGRSEIGTFKSLSNIKNEDVVSFFNKNIVANTTVAGISGDLSDGSILETLKQILESLGRNTASVPVIPEVTVRQGRRLFVIDKPNRLENNMYIVFNTKDLNFASPDYIKVALANNYLGGEEADSLLMKHMRSNKGYVYYIGTELDINNAGGPLFVNATLQNDRLIPSIRMILELYNNFVAKGLSQQDFNMEKAYLVNRSLFKAEITHLYMEEFIKQRIHNMSDNFDDNFVNNVKGIKLTELNAAIVQHFDTNPKNYYVYLVSTASQVLPKLQQEGLFDSVEVIPYDSLLKD